MLELFIGDEKVFLGIIHAMLYNRETYRIKQAERSLREIWYYFEGMIGLVKVNVEGIGLGAIKGFTLVGDPGCDGLGVEIMSIFNAACHEAAGDFTLIAGDIVPNGTNRFYKNVIDMLEATQNRRFYILAGNHDTQNYEDFFGRKDYFLYNDDMLLIVLDDSKRVFSRETLDLLRRALAYERENIVLAFHIPPPNKVSQNSVSEDEWRKVLDIIEPIKKKVRYILCGHVHSYFEDDLDGIKLIASGGGGARIEDVEGVAPPYYHFVEFTFGPTGLLHHEYVQVSYSKALKAAKPVLEALEVAYAGECQAHIRYRLYGEDALRKGKPGLAKLFFAAADSEFYHARNFYYALSKFKSLSEAVSESIANESEEVHDTYLNGLQLAKQQGSGLAAYAFEDAKSAESVHLQLLQEAERMLSTVSDVPERQYSTCTSCGYSFADMRNINFCPVCGAPLDKIREVRYPCP